jgi:hypothetical protein
VGRERNDSRFREFFESGQDDDAPGEAGGAGAGQLLNLLYRSADFMDLEHAVDGALGEGGVHEHDLAGAITIQFVHDLLQRRVPEDQQAPAPGGDQGDVGGSDGIKRMGGVGDLSAALQPHPSARMRTSAAPRRQVTHTDAPEVRMLTAPSVSKVRPAPASTAKGASDGRWAETAASPETSSIPGEPPTSWRAMLVWVFNSIDTPDPAAIWRRSPVPVR